jgi:hypothetical protein
MFGKAVVEGVLVVVMVCCADGTRSQDSTNQGQRNATAEAEGASDVERWLHELHNKVLSTRKDISLLRGQSQKRQKKELRDAGIKQKGKDQLDAITQERNRLQGIATRLAVPVLLKSPDIVSVTVYATKDGTFFLEAYGKEGGVPRKTYSGNASGVRPMSSGASDMASSLLRRSGAYSTIVTREDLQHLGTGTSPDGRQRRESDPLLDLRRRHKEELKKFERAMRLAAEAESCVRQARQATDRLADSPDALEKEMSKWNRVVKQKIDRALVVAKGVDAPVEKEKGTE